MDNATPSIVVGPDWKRAFGIYGFMCLIGAVLIASSSVAGGRSVGVSMLSLEMAGKILGAMLPIALALSPAFFFFFFSEKSREWWVFDQGVALTQRGKVIHEIPWDQITSVKYSPHGVNMALEGGEKKTLLFVGKRTFQQFLKLQVSSGDSDLSILTGGEYRR